MKLQISTLLFLALMTNTFAAEVGRPGELLGCWGGSEAETRFSDGVVQRTTTECTRFYSDSEIFVTCAGPNPGQPHGSHSSTRWNLRQHTRSSLEEAAIWRSR